jgi:hypothetical protein
MKLTDEMLEKGKEALDGQLSYGGGVISTLDNAVIAIWEAMEVETPMEKWRRENREEINRRQRNRYYRGKPRPEEG